MKYYIGNKQGSIFGKIEEKLFKDVIEKHVKGEWKEHDGSRYYEIQEDMSLKGYSYNNGEMVIFFMKGFIVIED